MSAGKAKTGSAVIDILAYTLARLILVVVLCGAIYGAARLLGVQDFPLIIALLFALIVAMPLGMWLFAPLRRRATASLSTAGADRRRERAKLQAQLRGEE